MAILTSSQLTFVDITDQRQLSAYLTSNRTTVQIYDTDNSTYNPDWSSNNLEIVPQVFLDQTNVQLTDSNLTVTWKRKDGNGAESNLSTGESVQNKKLIVSTNKLGATSSDMLTYICYVAYADQETKQTVNITAQLSYTLIRTASDAKTCYISGPQIFKYDTNGVLSGDDQIVLTGSVQHVSIQEWQYYNPTISTWTTYPTTQDNTNVTSGTLVVKPSHSIFDSAGVAKIKLTTSESDVFDIISITKLYDGRRGDAGQTGASAYTIILSNESHTFPGNTQYAELNAFALTGVSAYQGTSEKNVTITSVGTKSTNLTTKQDCGAYSGLYFQVSNNGSTNPGITFSINSSTFSTKSGSIPIVLTIDGISFTKYFSWSVAYTGSGACSLNITASSQIFKSSDGQTYTPDSITLTPVVQNLTLSNCTWAYSANGGSTYTNITSTTSSTSSPYINSSTKVLTVPKGSSIYTPTVTSIVFKCTNGSYYDTMTVSRLSDGQSASAAYTVIMSNEMQNIPTDTSLKPLSSMTYECDVVVYAGADQLSPTNNSTVGDGYFKITLPSNPTGITLGQSTAGKVTFAVTSSTAITASGMIDLSINIEGKSTVTKSISYAVSKSGNNGSSAVVFTVYAPNGTVFSNQSGSLLLSTSAYYGATQIASGATYQWAKYTNGAWQNVSGATSNSLTVNGNSVINIASYRCTMTYGGKSYVGVITLEDKSDPYFSEMLTVGGTTFKNGQGGSFVYVKVRTNGQEVDPLLGSLQTSQLSDDVGSNGQYYYYLNTMNGSITLHKHNGSSWTTSTDTQSLSYTWYLMDKNGNNDTFNNVDTSRTGKIIYLSCNDIDSIGTLQCDVSKN